MVFISLSFFGITTLRWNCALVVTGGRDLCCPIWYTPQGCMIRAYQVRAQEQNTAYFVQVAI
jgi:hypothetical protein